MTGAKFEQFTQKVATHRATCGADLAVIERTIRPHESATVALSCATCGAVFRATLTPGELVAAGDRADIERLFDQLTRRAIN